MTRALAHLACASVDLHRRRTEVTKSLGGLDSYPKALPGREALLAEAGHLAIDNACDVMTVAEKLHYLFS